MSLWLTVQNVSFNYGARPILTDLSFDIPPGITALVGPNGAGKSTLIKCIAGILKSRGSIRLTPPAGSFLRDGTAPLSERMSYLPQSLPTTAALTVFETVLLGLVNSLSLRVRTEQLEQVMATLTYLGIEKLASNRLDRLSGGQQQMVSLAQALVKNPALLLLDEPLNSLDLRYQFKILNNIREISRMSNRIILIAMHDLNLAGRYADQVLVIHNARVWAQGAPEAVITEAMIRDLYGIRSEVTVKDGRRPHIRLLDVAAWSAAV